MTAPSAQDAPSPWVARFAPLITAGGMVLDLACGRGRNTRLLAEQGYRVEAVDRDADALAELADIANVTPRRADLEGGPWPYYAHVFDGIVVCRYLWRPLFPQLFNCLNEGGVLIYETFMTGQERFGKPSNPAFLLRPGELLALMGKRFTVVAFEQGEIADARDGMQSIQRICVRRGMPTRLPLAGAPLPSPG